MYVCIYVCIYVVIQQPNAGSTRASSALMACGQPTYSCVFTIYNFVLCHFGIIISVTFNHTVYNYLLNQASVYCGDPGTPVNGWRTITGYTEGHTVAYTCNAEYKLSGNTRRTCQSNGEWSGNLPSCPRKCFALS